MYTLYKSIHSALPPISSDHKRKIDRFHPKNHILQYYLIVILRTFKRRNQHMEEIVQEFENIQIDQTPNLSDICEEIIEILAENEKCYKLPEILENLNVELSDALDPCRSKRHYLRAHLERKKEDFYRGLCIKLLEQEQWFNCSFSDSKIIMHFLNNENLSDLISGDIKNLFFSASSKPDLVLKDALSNEIVVYDQSVDCLHYDRKVSPMGLSWIDLVDWWSEKNDHLQPSELKINLYQRLIKYYDSEPELILTHCYYSLINEYGDDFPALIPQVYMHFDEKTNIELGGRKRLSRQRMDFLIIFSKNDRVVIEIDGKQHYSNKNKFHISENGQVSIEVLDIANPKKYSEMVAEDRNLRLSGYEIYRFGGFEFIDKEKVKESLKSFFKALLKKHHIHPK